ncbi:hypothetical protein PHMEG_00041874 [Phytophthora megakarya]|uniref:Uncharacterized protein n=1 Tax=Phytophthora megakarya TaxID=4795 RepID=A0A225UAV0_9STRA|nr:hypothetical protein PHMEG_00041874 [Phytophthora megakarya]
MATPQHEIWSMFTVEVARIPGEKQHPDARCTACQTIVKNAQPSAPTLESAMVSIRCPTTTEEGVEVTYSLPTYTKFRYEDTVCHQASIQHTATFRNTY